MAKSGITIEVNTWQLDEAIEKANRLVKLLQEASQLINSLSAGTTAHTDDGRYDTSADDIKKAFKQRVKEDIQQLRQQATERLNQSLE